VVLATPGSHWSQACVLIALRHLSAGKSATIALTSHRVHVSEISVARQVRRLQHEIILSGCMRFRIENTVRFIVVPQKGNLLAASP
jgi:hypothetical protein